MNLLLASAKVLSVRIRASTLIGLTYITLVGIYMVDIAAIVESSLSDCMIANGCKHEPFTLT